MEMSSGSVEKDIENSDKLWTDEREAEVINTLQNDSVGLQRNRQFYYIRSNFKVVSLAGVKKVARIKDGRVMATKDNVYSIVKDLHIDCGHRGEKRTYEMVAQLYANIPMSIIKSFINQCERCAERIKKTASLSSRVVLPPPIVNEQPGRQEDLMIKLKLEKQLKRWRDSQRTRYGELSSTKTGHGTPSKISERDTWISQPWQILDDHSVKMPSGQNANKLSKQQPSSSAGSSTAGESTSAGPSTMDTCSAGPSIDIADSSDDDDSHSSSQEKKRKQKSISTEEDFFNRQQKMFEQLLARVSKTKEDGHEPTITKTPHQQAVEQFVAYLSTQCQLIRQEDWFQFTSETLLHVNNYVSKARYLQQYYGQTDGQQQVGGQQQLPSPTCPTQSRPDASTSSPGASLGYGQSTSMDTTRYPVVSPSDKGSNSSSSQKESGIGLSEVNVSFSNFISDSQNNNA